MYQVLLSGPEYNTDNTRVWEELKKRCLQTISYEWIKESDNTSDGRKAWFALLAILEGEDAQNKSL